MPPKQVTVTPAWYNVKAQANVDLNGKNLSLGAGSLKTTNLLLKEENSSAWVIRDAADTAYKGLQVSGISAITGVSYFYADIEFSADGQAIRVNNTDDYYSLFKARDTGVGLVEVGRIQGAADPYFGMGGSQEFKFTNGGLMGLYGATPVAQQAHIVDADGTLADITTKFNTLLADLEGFGLLAAS